MKIFIISFKVLVIGMGFSTFSYAGVINCTYLFHTPDRKLAKKPNVFSMDTSTRVGQLNWREQSVQLSCKDMEQEWHCDVSSSDQPFPHYIVRVRFDRGCVAGIMAPQPSAILYEIDARDCEEYRLSCRVSDDLN